METRRGAYALIGWVGLMLSAAVTGATPTVPPAIEWAPQEPIPGYTSRTWTPYLVADRDQTVHAFGSQWRGPKEDELALIHSQWTLADGWTTPQDIMAPPYRRQAAVQGVVLDRAGLLHLVFFGGDDLDARIYYTRAPLDRAGRASAWSWPRIIGPAAVTPRAAALAVDEGGHLVVVYGGRVNSVGLYALYSKDGGETWSDPALVAATGDDELRPWVPDLLPGDDGRAHVVWNVVNRRGHNVSGHYAHLDLGAQRSSEVAMIDRAVGVDEGMGLALPAITRHGGKLIVVYNNGIPPSGVPPAHWFRQSSDGGASWTPAARAFRQHVGRNGRIAFATDSAQTLHVLFGQRIPLHGADATHGLWHSQWAEDRWSDPEAVVAGPRRPDFDPYEVRAVVSQGNVLLVAWMTDPGLKAGGTWYSYARLNAPELPSETAYSVVAVAALLMVGAGTAAVATITALMLRRSARRRHANA